MQIGIDIVRIERVKKIYERYGERFLKKVFSEREIAYCLGKRNAAECLAGRFAAKEAFYKALETDLQKKITLKEIEILADTSKRPYYNLPPHLDGISTALSITHEREYAVAVCTVIRRSK